jgi:hypothetical protein
MRLSDIFNILLYFFKALLDGQVILVASRHGIDVGRFGN